MGKQFKINRNKQSITANKKKELLDRMTRLQTLHDVLNRGINRSSFFNEAGYQYGSSRKVYKALGYPSDTALDYSYYLGRYKRQDMSNAVIKKPVEACWNNFVTVKDSEEPEGGDTFKTAWEELDKRLKLRKTFTKLDKVTGLGEYGVLLFGFDDVKNQKDFQKPASGKLRLIYVKAVSQPNAGITEWETDTKNPRYGQPKMYQIKVGEPGQNEAGISLLVHHSRVVHVTDEQLESDIFGMPRLMPIINRLIDLEKLMGGDAEMFWRGARPGYTAIPKDDFELDDDQFDDLERQLDKYENDLRRFITAEGVDIQALTQQVADPKNHVEIQIQGISAQTNIPKRILVGSERGELSSEQDKVMWLKYIKSRMEDWAEPDIIVPFIEKCQNHNILPSDVEYTVVWQDLFAPSEKEKAEVGKTRAESINSYTQSLGAQDIMPRMSFYKYILGLSDDQAEAVDNDVNDQIGQEDNDFTNDSDQEDI